MQWQREHAGSPFSDAADRAVLSQIVDLGPIRLSDLADAEGRTPSNTSKIVQGLVLGGYVRRRIPENDRRVTLLEPTEQGRAVMARIVAFDLQLIERHLSTFTDDEVRTFAELMSAFTQRIVSWKEAELPTAGGQNSNEG